MKRLSVVALALLAACENPSKLDASKGGAPGAAPRANTAGGGTSAEVEAALRSIDARLKALETAHSPGAHDAGGAGEQSVVERIHRVEAMLARREESFGFLDMAYAQQKRQMEQKEAQEADPTAVFAVDVTGPIKGGQLEGPATAPVTVIKAFDFACPYCEKLNAPLHELVKEYGGKLRVVYMNLVVHPDTAQNAHLYSCAAAKQQKYLEWKDAFWQKGFNVYVASRGKDVAAMSEDNILKISGELGLNLDKLKADAHGDDCRARIEQDRQELTKFRVSGTPGLFINGQFINGAISKPQFKKIIDEKLALVAQSGVTGDYYQQEIMGKGVRQFRSKRDAAGRAPTQ